MRTKYVAFCLMLAAPLAAQIESRSSGGSASKLSAPSLGAGASPLSETWIVGAGGVVASSLVQTDNSAPLKIVAAATGAYGVALSTAAAGQSVEVARYGTVNCLTDTGGATAGDLVVIGTGTVTHCKDSGQTASGSIPIGTRVIGVFRSSAAAGTNALVELTPAHFGTQVSGGGGGGTWGSITGTLSNQTDLESALNGKQASLGYTAENAANKGAASGYAPLNGSAQVPLANLPAIPASQVSGLPAFPAGTIVGASDAQTLSAKTLTAPSLGAGSSPVTETWTAGAGGVTANTLVQTDGSVPLKVVAATNGVYGVALSTVSAGGTVEVARFGTVNCIADTGGATAGDLVVIGTGSAIDCKDAGVASSASVSMSARIIGVFRSSAAAGSAALVELTPAHFGTQLAWGSLTGTLASQTDLQTALNGKQASLGYSAENSANKDSASGYAGLDAGGKLKTSEAPNWTTFPAPGTSVTLSGNSEIYVCTAACTITVPVPSAGAQYCVMNDDNVSSSITLSALGSAAMYESQGRTGYGTAGTGTIVSSGQTGDSICIVGRDSTHYLTVASTGSWTAN